VADGGTLFLDEIGDLRPALQAKLLRLVQEQGFERVGGIRTLKVDVRFIASTSTNLEALLRRGTFRQDLYYRLKVVTVTLPALRDRKEDLEILTHHFIEKYGAELKRPPKPVSPEAAALPAYYDWPGNVCELENAVERAVTLSTDSEIGPHDLPILEPTDERAADRTGAGRYHDAVSQFKRQFLQDALAKAGGNQTRAAEALGLRRTYLARLLKEYGIRSQ
jgi:DNA-binding NtrC family response regulator